MSKIIITDIDECVLNWHEGFDAYVKSKNIPHTGSIHECKTLEEWLDIPEDEAYDLIVSFNHTEAFGKLSPGYESEETLRILKNHGYKFYGLTSCGSEDYIKSRRRENIEKYFPGIFEEIVCIPLEISKRQELKNLPHNAIWVEDKFSNSELGLEFGHICYLINHEHNEDFHNDDIIRVDGWKNIANDLI